MRILLRVFLQITFKVLSYAEIMRTRKIADEMRATGLLK